MSFPRAQLHIVSSRTEPKVSKLLIKNSTLYQLIQLCRHIFSLRLRCKIAFQISPDKLKKYSSDCIHFNNKLLQCLVKVVLINKHISIYRIAYDGESLNSTDSKKCSMALSRANTITQYTSQNYKY